MISGLQVYVEDVYLHNDEILGLQTNENHHIFQWLKFQANQGAPDAEVRSMSFIEDKKTKTR